MKKGFTHILNYRKKLVCGFTLLEILLVVGIIAILAGIVIVALNPTKQFAQVRNTQRKVNLSELNKALYQYYIDNSRYPTSVTTTLTEICDTEATSTGHSLNCTNKIDLSYLVPTYLVAIPTDPQASGTSTGYLVAKNTANKVYLKADNAELSQTTVIGDSSGVLPDHLVSYWSFDGNANDSWGSNNGTIVGATATTGVRGLASSAYGFDGVNDRIDVSSNIVVHNLSYLSYSAWVKKGSCAAWGQIMGKETDTNTRVMLSLDSNCDQLYGGLSNSITNTGGISGIILSDNNWHHVVMSYDGTTGTNDDRLKLYFDGVSTSLSYSGTIPATTPNNSANPFKIGNRDAGNGDVPFAGSIDNIRVYNKALSAEEVLNIYNAEKP